MRSLTERESLLARLLDVLRRVETENAMPPSLRRAAAIFDAINLYVEIDEFNQAYPEQRIEPIRREAA